MGIFPFVASGPVVSLVMVCCGFVSGFDMLNVSPDSVPAS